MSSANHQKPVRCQDCGAWIFWRYWRNRKVRLNAIFADDGSAKPHDRHHCARTRRGTALDDNPIERLPYDRILVRETTEGSRYKPLSQVLYEMRKEREARKWMSAANFKKNFNKPLNPTRKSPKSKPKSEDVSVPGTPSLFESES